MQVFPDGHQNKRITNRAGRITKLIFENKRVSLLSPETRVGKPRKALLYNIDMVMKRYYSRH